MQQPWHSLSVEQTLQVLNSTKSGLANDMAKQRLTDYGYNKLKPAQKSPLIVRFFKHFHNLLIYVLLLAAIVTLALGHWLDTSVILGVVIINAIIGFVQEEKAEKALAAISHMLAQESLVIRESKRTKIASELLVPGDIVLLQAGDKVAADVRIIEARNLQIQESILTGESLDVEKTINPIAEQAILADRKNMAFSGTLITRGKGLGVVVATGQTTEIGHISTMLENVERITTPLLRRINRFAKHLSIGIGLIGLFTFLFGLFIQNYTAKEMFLATVGLIVAAIPEGLPAIITITLAIGVVRMAKHHSIIRLLPAVEALGSVTVICTDKTGTLTKNELMVQNIVTSFGTYTVSGSGYNPTGDFYSLDEVIDLEKYQDIQAIIEAVVLCNDAEIRQVEGDWHCHGSPTDGAFLALGMKTKRDLSLLKQAYPVTDLIPFESEHKFMATLHHDQDGNGYIYVKGAPEKIVALCSQQYQGHSLTPIDEQYWQQKIHYLASHGQRVLAVAKLLVSTQHRELKFTDIQSGFVMLAVFGLIDMPREHVKDSVLQSQQAGIQVKMITGDHIATARAIADQIGMLNTQHALVGSQLDEMTDQELLKCIEEVSIFARTTPQHKLRLVKMLQQLGHIVVMTGDGVNDAPALKQADVGVAMGKKGTSAAKEAADMVITDDRFTSIVHAVKEGRTVYDNLIKAIIFIIPSNGGEALAILGAVLLGITLPITAIQILWVNLITAITLAIALAFEPAEADVMLRRPRKTKESIFNAFLIWRIIFVSLLLVGITFGMYLWAINYGYSLEAARTIAVNTLVIGEVAYLFNSRKLYLSVLNYKGLFENRMIWLMVGLVVISQLLFTYTIPMQHLFGVQAIDLLPWVLIVGLAAIVFLAVELEKYCWRKYHSVLTVNFEYH